MDKEDINDTAVHWAQIDVGKAMNKANKMEPTRQA